MRLRPLYDFIGWTRQFFKQKDFLEVITPPLMDHPGIEVHIHPFQAYRCHRKQLAPYYLHSSPEFAMKQLLSENKQEQDLYTLCYCFRDEPKGQWHRPQFLMLEWYRVSVDYHQIIKDFIQWWGFCQKQAIAHGYSIHHQTEQQWVIKTINEIFQEELNINILDYLDLEKLKEMIQKKFTHIPLPLQECSWDDYFFLLFLNEIEPKLKKYPYLILKDYPAPLSALSKISKDDARVCERFEVYINGIELANCFSELQDYQEQKDRAESAMQEKQSLYQYQLPQPKSLLTSLKRGLPQCSGIAVGVERAAMSLLQLDHHLFWDDDTHS